MCGAIMPMKNTGTANVRLQRSRRRHSMTSLARVRLCTCVASSWSEIIASKPISSIRSTISRGPIRERSNLILQVSVASETATDVIPGTDARPVSTVEVQEEQVMP